MAQAGCRWCEYDTPIFGTEQGVRNNLHNHAKTEHPDEYARAVSRPARTRLTHPFRPATVSGEDMCTYSWRVESERTYCQRPSAEHDD